MPLPEDEHGPFSFYSEPGALTIEASADAGADGPSAGSGQDKPALPRFSMIAYTGGPMRIAGWRYPVVVDLAGLSIPSQSRPVRFGHDMASGVGHTDSIRVEGPSTPSASSGQAPSASSGQAPSASSGQAPSASSGQAGSGQARLVAAGVVSRDTAAAKEIVASARNGFPWQASLGAAVEQFEFVKEDQSVHVNGREFKGPLNVVRKATLGEMSFVDLGADGNTTASVAARQARDGAAAAPATPRQSKEKETMTDTEITQEQTKVVAANKAAAQADGAGTPQQSSGQAETAPVADPAPDIRAKALAETKRIESIRKVCAGRHGTIEAKAIEEGWDENTTELEVLRAERPKAPPNHIPVSPAVGSDVLAAAVCLAGGLQPAESRFDDRTLEAAGWRFRSGIGLQELIMEAAWGNGYSGRSFRSDMEGCLRAAFSTFSLPGILSNVANKFLLAGFESVEDTWRRIAATRNVRDFKAVTSYRLTGAFEYQEVGPTGELKHGQVDEESFTNQAKTYGRMFGVTRADFINDDLGALTALPRKIGRGGALKLNKVFWTGFLNNAAFFTTGRANYQAGADTALSIDGLTAAELLFLEQKDAEGSPLGVVPSVLLVPPALLVRGTQFMQATELRDTTASTKYATNNPHAGKFTVAHSAYLSNAGISGYSAKAWYLLADPNDLPVIEVAFLNGQQTPTVERADADFNVLGIQFRGYFDFGVALQEASATRLEAIPFAWHRGEVIAQG